MKVLVLANLLKTILYYLTNSILYSVISQATSYNNIYVNSYEMILNIPVLPLIGEFSLQGLHH